MTQEDSSDIPGIGARLRAARERKKASLADVAAQTRIPLRHLESIENGAWDALPAATYCVGFARAYANAVGLDGNEIGTELRQELGTPRHTYDAPADYYQPADPTRVPPRSLALGAALVAALLIGGYAVWRTGSLRPDAPAPVAAVPAEMPATAPGAAPAPAAAGPVVLTATDAVWLRVSDGAGTLFEREMAAGERYEVPATATAPRLRTGRPQALRVTVGDREMAPLGEPEQTVDDISLLAADLAAGPAAAPSASAGPAPLSLPPPAF